MKCKNENKNENPKKQKKNCLTFSSRRKFSFFTECNFSTTRHPLTLQPFFTSFASASAFDPQSFYHSPFFILFVLLGCFGLRNEKILLWVMYRVLCPRYTIYIFSMLPKATLPTVLVIQFLVFFVLFPFLYGVNIFFSLSRFFSPLSIFSRLGIVLVDKKELKDLVL